MIYRIINRNHIYITFSNFISHQLFYTTIQINIQIPIKLPNNDFWLHDISDNLTFSPKLNQPFDEDKDEGEAITSLIKRIFENAVGSEKGRLKKKRNFNAP
jgi:hypothetical protein